MCLSAGQSISDFSRVSSRFLVQVERTDTMNAIIMNPPKRQKETFTHVAKIYFFRLKLSASSEKKSKEGYKKLSFN